MLWNRSPEFARKHAPAERILTITQWWLHGAQKRIVLRDRILVIDEPSTSGSEPSIVGEVALDAAGLERIQGALSGLPTSALGKDYRADGVMDGIGLHFSFQPDGEPGPTSVAISKTWVKEFRPLLTTVSELGPKDFPSRVYR